MSNGVVFAQWSRLLIIKLKSKQSRRTQLHVKVMYYQLQDVRHYLRLQKHTCGESLIRGNTAVLRIIQYSNQESKLHSYKSFCPHFCYVHLPNCALYIPVCCLIYFIVIQTFILKKAVGVIPRKRHL